MKYLKLLLLLLPLTVHGKPELLRAEKAEIPFVGEAFSGDSKGGGDYSLKVIRQNTFLSVNLVKGGGEIHALRLPTSMDVYSVFWNDAQCWFLIRKFDGVSSKVISLVSCDPQKNQGDFVFYGIHVSNGERGWIFCLDGARPDGVIARCGIRPLDNPRKIDYMSGLLKTTDLVELDEKELQALMIPRPGDDGPRVLERQKQ